MPLIWSVESQERLFVVVADGNVERAEVDAMLDDLVASGSLAYGKLFDGLRGSTTMGTEDLMAIGVRLKDLAQGTDDLGPLALVIPDDKFDIVARVLGILATAERPMRMFKDAYEARAWLEALDIGETVTPGRASK